MKSLKKKVMLTFSDSTNCSTSWTIVSNVGIELSILAITSWASNEWSAIRFKSEYWLCLFKWGSKNATGKVELKAPKHDPRAGLCLSNSVFRYFLSCDKVKSVPNVYKADRIL